MTAPAKRQAALFEEAPKVIKPKTQRRTRGAEAVPAKKTEIVVHNPVQPQPPAAPTTFLEVLYRASVDPRCDAAKMETLLNMQERIEATEARKAFTVAFNALQAELPVITKDGLIDHGEGTTARGNAKLKASYSTYPNLMRICRPLLKKHGFTFNNTTEPTADGTRIAVVGYLTHVGGHGMKTSFPLGADAGPGRSNAQAWGSASSYGKRYNLILLLDIVSEAPFDQDDDARKKSKAKIVETDASDPISTGRGGDTFPGDKVFLSEKQAMELRDAIEACGVPMKVFTDKFGEVSKLAASEFRNALASCANYKKAQDGKK